MTALEFVFWAGAALVVYAYVGYGLAIALLSRWLNQPVRHTDALPRVTLLIAAYNEEDVLAEKLENSLTLDYPADRLEILVVADGSRDGTCDVARAYADRGVRLEYLPERRGKNHAVNRVVPLATGEVVVFSDANSMFAHDSLRKLVRNFADDNVALVAGEKRIRRGPGTVSEGEGLYWRYESWLKRLDSRVSSVMGAAGEIFAVRKARYAPPPEDSIIEDFVLSMGLVKDRQRVVYEPEAVSYEDASPDAGEEFKRKARIVAGGWQAVVRLWPLLTPAYGVISFQYVSHRVLRWCVVPFLLPLLVVINAALAFSAGPFYAALLALQLGFYALAALGHALERRGRMWKPAYLPFFFTFMNVAALAGAWRYVSGRQSVVWEKARRATQSGQAA